MQNARLDKAQTGIKIAGDISVTLYKHMKSSLWQKAKKY